MQPQAEGQSAGQNGQQPSSIVDLCSGAVAEAAAPGAVCREPGRAWPGYYAHTAVCASVCVREKESFVVLWTVLLNCALCGIIKCDNGPFPVSLLSYSNF